MYCTPFIRSRIKNKGPFGTFTCSTARLESLSWFKLPQNQKNSQTIFFATRFFVTQLLTAKETAQIDLSHIGFLPVKICEETMLLDHWALNLQRCWNLAKRMWGPELPPEKLAITRHLASPPACWNLFETEDATAAPKNGRILATTKLNN